MSSQGTGPRDWWVIVGMAVAAISAAVASISGLRGLAIVAGRPAGPPGSCGCCPKATELRRRLAAETTNPTEGTDRKEASPSS